MYTVILTVAVYNVTIIKTPKFVKFSKELVQTFLLIITRLDFLPMENL